MGFQIPEITIGKADPAGSITKNLPGIVTGEFNKNYSNTSNQGMMGSC